MDRAAEEKKWQAQLQLQRDQMAAQQAARSFTLIKEAATHRTKRGRIAAVVAATMEWCSQKQPQYMKV